MKKLTVIVENNKFSTSVLCDLEGVSRNVLLSDGAEDLHPLGKHLPGDQVQGQHELGQGEVDLEDLLLDRHRALAVVGQQLNKRDNNYRLGTHKKPKRKSLTAPSRVVNLEGFIPDPAASFGCVFKSSGSDPKV